MVPVWLASTMGFTKGVYREEGMQLTCIRPWFYLDMCSCTFCTEWCAFNWVHGTLADSEDSLNQCLASSFDETEVREVGEYPSKWFKLTKNDLKKHIPLMHGDCLILYVLIEALEVYYYNIWALLQNTGCFTVPVHQSGHCDTARPVKGSLVIRVQGGLFLTGKVNLLIILCIRQHKIR